MAGLSRVDKHKSLGLDRLGNMYVTDAVQNRIRKVDSSGGISTVAGTGNCCYENDGGLSTNADLNAPWGLAIDAGGNLYFADSGNQAIRSIQAGSGPAAQLSGQTAVRR